MTIKDQIRKTKLQCEEVFGVDGASIMFDNLAPVYITVINRLNVYMSKSPRNFIQVIDVVFNWIYLKLEESDNVTFNS